MRDGSVTAWRVIVNTTSMATTMLPGRRAGGTDTADFDKNSDQEVQGGVLAWPAPLKS